AGEVVKAIDSAGGSAATIALDVREPASVEAAISQVLEAHGQLDVLVSAAGGHRDGWLATMPRDAWHDAVRTDLDGTMLCARAALRSMMARRAGSIVCVTSVAGLHASPGQANSAASKGGVLAFVRTLAAEVAAHGVRV